MADYIITLTAKQDAALAAFVARYNRDTSPAITPAQALDFWATQGLKHFMREQDEQAREAIVALVAKATPEQRQAAIDALQT